MGQYVGMYVGTYLVPTLHTAQAQTKPGDTGSNQTAGATGSDYTINAVPDQTWSNGPRRRPGNMRHHNVSAYIQAQTRSDQTRYGSMPGQ